MSASRREFLRRIGLGSAGLAWVLASGSELSRARPRSQDLFFDISLAEFSLFSAFQAGELSNLEFPARAVDDFGVSAVEYVNWFFEEGPETSYVQKLKQRTDDLGVDNVRIMIDQMGPLAALDESARAEAVDNHKPWVDAAALLGCTDVRVNLRSDEEEVDWDAMAEAGVDGLGRIAEYAAREDLAVVVENHGGPTSDGSWLAGVMDQVDRPNVGTLPDFGNFCIEQAESEGGGPGECVNEYDPYQGVRELMPYAEGVSAKSYRFDEEGHEMTIDYVRMLEIVRDAGFEGYVGIEYEGSFMAQEGVEGALPPDEGILATRQLLERVGAELS